jgi:hypothetical protein
VRWNRRISCIRLSNWNKSAHTSEERELAARIEAIPIERVCNSISSGKQILGDDHVTVWSDHKRYYVAGWHVENSVPISYWTSVASPPHSFPQRGNVRQVMVSVPIVKSHQVIQLHDAEFGMLELALEGRLIQ